MKKLIDTAHQIDVKTAAYWLSEAWGEDIPQSHIRVRKNWLFVRYPNYIDDKASLKDPAWNGYGYRQIRRGWEDEVDCLRSPSPSADPGMVTSNDLWAEPFSDIKYRNSPFVPHNHERVNQAIEKLNEEWEGE
jgi:hypothetical protein